MAYSSKKTAPSTKDPGAALKAILAQAAAPPFLLVISPDRTRRERIVSSLLKKFCKGYEQNKAENLLHLKAESLNQPNFIKLLDEVSSISLFSPQKFILIDEVEEMNSAYNKKIVEMLDTDNPSTFLIITAAKLPANSVIYNFFKKKNALLELEELKNQDLRRWVEKELRAAGVKFSDEILPEAIIQSCESDPDKAIELIERLSLYTDSGEAKLEDLGRLSKLAPDASEFALIEQLPNKKAAWKNELLLDQIFSAGKNSFALLGLLSRTYSNYLQMAYLREKGFNQQQIRQSLNMSPWLFGKQYEASKHYSVKQLLRSIKAILTADAKLKNRSLGDEAIFSELIRGL